MLRMHLGTPPGLQRLILSRALYKLTLGHFTIFRLMLVVVIFNTFLTKNHNFSEISSLSDSLYQNTILSFRTQSRVQFLVYGHLSNFPAAIEIDQRYLIPAMPGTLHFSIRRIIVHGDIS